MKFMHCLLSCYVQELPCHDLKVSPITSPEHLSEMPTTFFPVELRLSHICKRVIYFKEEESR